MRVVGDTDQSIQAHPFPQHPPQTTPKPTPQTSNTNQVLVDREHPNFQVVKPVVDVGKARAAFVNCTSEQCGGQCTPDLVKGLGGDKVCMCVRAYRGVDGDWFVPTMNL